MLMVAQWLVSAANIYIDNSSPHALFTPTTTTTTNTRDHTAAGVELDLACVASRPGGEEEGEKSRLGRVPGMAQHGRMGHARGSWQSAS